jgi:uncharacterized protein with HEPN domain
MLPDRDPATILDIRRAAQLVLEFKADLAREDFLKDLKTQSAVLHQLLVIGEAVKRLSTEYRAEHPTVPWALIAGMRDKLIHGYDAVDLHEVWKTASDDMPKLLAELKPKPTPDQG